jgi:hypothetical protein
MTGALYFARVSGGNDSIAMLQCLREHRLKNVVVVNSDTGWASEAWAERMPKVEAWVRSLGWEWVSLVSEGFEAMVMRQTETGMFPTRQRKFCTKYLKIKPFLKWAAEADPEKRAVVCVGVRRAESEARANAPAFMPGYDNGRHVWHPIVEFDDASRDAMILKTPFEVLPHRSKECFCINWNRDDLLMAEPDHIDRVRALEARVGRPMFNPAGKMGAVGIDEVMRWAASPRGKYRPPNYRPDMPLLEEIEEPGCDEMAAGCGL